MVKKVFLGGTCNGSSWRQKLIKKLKIDYFDPVVDDWDEEAQKNEIYEREHCDYCLFTITPLMSGFYSIAEVVDDSNKRPERTLLCILKHEFVPGTGSKRGKLMYDGRVRAFTREQSYSLKAVCKLVKRNGAHVFDNLDDVACYLNEKTTLKKE